MTDDIEVLKLLKLISQQNIDNIDKEYDERNWLDIIVDNESDERDQMRSFSPISYISSD